MFSRRIENRSNCSYLYDSSFNSFAMHGRYGWLDFLIEDIIIVELKSVEKTKAVHKKQLLTYLRLANKPLGLLINFNVAVLKDGVSRIINNRYEAI